MVWLGSEKMAPYFLKYMVLGEDRIYSDTKHIIKKVIILSTYGYTNNSKFSKTKKFSLLFNLVLYVPL